MNYKNIMGLLVVSTFAIKGLYRLNQYYCDKRDFIHSLADISKDGIDGINDLAGVFANDKQETDLCEKILQIGKAALIY